MLFFELLQVALGNRVKLSHVPTPEDWMGVYDEPERQAVTGILLQGIERLPAEQRPVQEILLQWIGVGQMIEQQNHQMDERCVELLGRIQDAGLHGSILKGQGIALLYDKELRYLRQSGDIDVYANCGIRKAIAFAQAQGLKDVEWDYKHLHLNLWDDTEVEMHYRVEVLLNLWKNRKLQKWFKAHTEEIFGHTENTESTEKDSTTNFKNDTNYSPAESTEHAERFSPADCNATLSKREIKEIAEIITPTVEFNVFYILLNIYRHFLYEGVGMR